MRTVTSILTIAFVLLLATLGNAISSDAYTNPEAPPAGYTITKTEQQGTEICFPQESWSAYYEDRPCDMLWRPFEDGSTTLYLGTYGSDAAVCNIPNPYEERGQFVVHCHRMPNQ